MKLKELKHNHSLTDLLKIFIFSLLMLAPILSVATRCLYVVCNKNAYQSYYGETINQTNTEQITTWNDIVKNKKYLFTNNSYLTYQNIGTLNISVSNVKNNTNTTDLSEVNMISLYPNIYQGSERMYIAFYKGNTLISAMNMMNNYTNYEFELLDYSYTYNNANYFLNYLYRIEYNNYSYLDNVFEYSVHSLEDNQLFNWTKNTAVYTGVNAMTSNLEIEGSVIPILITYWFLLTIIYVIIDIVLKLFTILTHMIGNKTA